MNINDRNRPFKTPSLTSPKSSHRACLCVDSTYSRKCCDGSLQAQGIGSITGIVIKSYLIQEEGYLLQENNDKILLNNG